MGLDDLIDDGPDRVKDEERKLNEKTLCPKCGNEGEEHKYYYRCTSDPSVCRVTTYHPVERIESLDDLDRWNSDGP